MENMKLVDLKEGSFHSTKDYVNALKHLIDNIRVRTYIEARVLVAPMDYSGQLHVQHAIVHCASVGDSSGIPEQILHIIPMIGPLHISLNSRETIFLANY